MSALVAFLRPSRLEFVFIAEWSAFFILIWAREGALQGRQQAALRTGAMTFVALGPAGLGHAIKALVYHRLPYGDSIAMVPDHLHLAHLENRAASQAMASRCFCAASSWVTSMCPARSGAT